MWSKCSEFVTWDFPVLERFGIRGLLNGFRARFGGNDRPGVEAVLKMSAMVAPGINQEIKKYELQSACTYNHTYNWSPFIFVR